MPIAYPGSLAGAKPSWDKLYEMIDAINANTAARATDTEHDHQVTLYPEWPGAVWHALEGAPGGAYGYYQQSSGALDTQYEGAGGRAYYKWFGDGASQVQERVAIKWRLPETFTGWQTAGDVVEFYLWTTDGGGDAELDATLYRNTTQVVAVTDQTSAAAWGSVGWTSAEISGGAWSAADELTLELKLRATATKIIRVAEINFHFKGY
jgi:hypothetical protein